MFVYTITPPAAAAKSIYVGAVDREEQLPQRIRNHFSDARMVGTPTEKKMRVCREIRALLDQGFTRDDFTIEFAGFPDEDTAIDHYRALGFDVWNQKPGGAGRRAGCKNTDYAPVAHRLGTVPDRVIADELGLKTSTVAKERNRRGIDPFGRGRKKKA